jgi:glycosyltransferase involved in cell wall biosynthesis
VYRLFAFSPGQRVPDTRLHFVPVPTSIPRDRWLRTTIRIQHVAGLTAERRAARYAKYCEVDPRAEYQAGYDHLLGEPDEIRPFEPRPPGLPVLADLAETPGLAAGGEAATEPERPVLSAIVISRDDEDRIERTVRSVVEQRCDLPFEVIVVTSGTDRTASIVRERFPQVRLVELDHPALPGEARNAGLRLARGAYVSFPGSHVELPPGSLAARIAAHEQGWTMVTGTTRNGNDTLVGWAAYFLDQSTVLPGRPSEPLDRPPAHCSYEAAALLATGGFPEDVRAGEDTWVNEVLFRAGHRAWRAADVPLVHHNRSRTVRHLVRHHFQRGRAQVQFFRALAPGREGDRRAAAFLWAYPTRRLARIDRNVQVWGGELGRRYRRVRPLVRLGVLAAWVGAHVELRLPSRRMRPPVPTGGGGRTGLAARAQRRRGSAAADGPSGAVVRTPAVEVPLHRPLRLRRDRPAPWQGARPILVEVPGTAADTLRGILEREYAGRPHLCVDDPETGWRVLEALDDDRRRALAFVAGPVGFGIHRLLPGRNVYLILVRDPVERVLALHHDLRSRPDGPGRRRARGETGPFAGAAGSSVDAAGSLEEFVRSSALPPWVHDGQTRLLAAGRVPCGSPLDAERLARARAVIDRADVIVGVEERFDESLLLMVRALGWGLPAWRAEHAESVRPRDAGLPADTVALIRERNALDAELYEHARRRVDRELAEVPDLAEQLDALRLAGGLREVDPRLAGPDRHPDGHKAANR